jgi:hypothetical protein
VPLHAGGDVARGEGHVGVVIGVLLVGTKGHRTGGCVALDEIDVSDNETGTRNDT